MHGGRVGAFVNPCAGMLESDKLNSLVETRVSVVEGAVTQAAGWDEDEELLRHAALGRVGVPPLTALNPGHVV